MKADVIDDALDDTLVDEAGLYCFCGSLWSLLYMHEDIEAPLMLLSLLGLIGAATVEFLHCREKLVGL